MNTFGLTPEQHAILTALLKQYLPHGDVLVYGSRAQGNFSARSDMDLAIQSAGTTDTHLLAELAEAIDESDFPYLCDIQYWENIKNPRLLEHIEKVGKNFYRE